MKVIGVAGQAQNGKDTLADYLAKVLNKADENYLNVWYRQAFASNVKKVFCDAFGVDNGFIEKWKVKEELPPGFDKPVRKSLQFIGDGFRQIKSSIWLDLVFKDDINKIISDTRYVNEFRRVKREGGLNILICKPDRINSDSNGSEAEIRPYVDYFLSITEERFTVVKDLILTDAPEFTEEFDVFIKNDGTVEDLYNVIDEKLVPFVNFFSFKE